jgi:hypothetical protein
VRLIRRHISLGVSLPRIPSLLTFGDVATVADCGSTELAEVRQNRHAHPYPRLPVRQTQERANTPVQNRSQKSDYLSSVLCSLSSVLCSLYKKPAHNLQSCNGGLDLFKTSFGKLLAVVAHGTTYITPSGPDSVLTPRCRELPGDEGRASASMKQSSVL